MLCVDQVDVGGLLAGRHGLSGKWPLRQVAGLLGLLAGRRTCVLSDVNDYLVYDIS
jgi:hypothetical protein